MQYALLATTIYGFATYVNSELAGKYGAIGIFPLAFGSILVWAVYSFHKRHEPAFYRGNRTRQIGVVMRAIVYIVGCIFAAVAFGFSGRAGINRGIVVALFTSNVVFTTIIFALIYGERINSKEASGMILVIVSVFCISYSDAEPPTNTTTLTDQQQNYYLIMAVVWSVGAGFVFSLTALVSKHYTSRGDFTPLKLTIDGLFVSGIALLAGYFYLGGHSKYTWLDDLLGTLVGVGLVLGSICATTAFRYGKGGPI